MALSYADFSLDIMANSIAKHIPVAGLFELTARCNFRCKMCYICGMEDHSTLIKSELTADQWIELGRQARDAGMLFLTLTGGEIFIRKDFWQIYEALTQMGLIITLFTNASLLTDEMIERLAELPPLKVSVSIYGSNPTTYGNVTGHPEAYQKVIDNIRKLTDAGIKVHLKTTVLKYNSDEYDQILELAQSTGHNLDIVNYISPRREGTGSDPLANRLSPQELANYELRAFPPLKPDDSRNTGIKTPRVTTDDIMTSEHLQKNLWAALANKPTGKKYAFRCAAGRGTFWISWEGKLFPCGLLCDIVSEPLKIGFEESWHDIIKKCEDVPISSECENCASYANCMTCPARRKVETGEYTSPPAYLCELVKAEADVLASR